MNSWRRARARIVVARASGGGIGRLLPSVPQQAASPFRRTPQVLQPPAEMEEKMPGGGVAWP